MSSTFWGMQHINENILCAVRCELTGPDPENHELVEVAVLPLNSMLQVHDKFPLFNLRMRPDNIDTIDYQKCRLSKAEIAATILRGIDRSKGADIFWEWYKAIGLKEKKRIIALAHGWPRERALLINWLGYENFTAIFSEDYRDVLIAAHFINDRNCVRAEPCVFNKQDLRWCSKKMNVEQLQRGGSAMSDCLCIAETYKRMLQL